MKMQALIFLLSISLSTFASTQIIAERLYPSPLDAFCLEEGQLHNDCSNTQATASGHYDALFKRPHDTIAFGFNSDTAYIIAACKNNKNFDWYDCSPAKQFPYFTTVASSPHAEFMMVGSGQAGTLIATCLNAKQEWHNCTPEQHSENFYTRGAVAYGNGQWMVLSGTRDWIDGQTIIPAFCMAEKNQTWQTCDIKINDPDQSQFHSIFAFDALTYLPREKRWLAVGMGGKNLFKSICKHDNEILWEDCTDGEFPSNGVQRLVQNNAGDLLQINIASEFTPDDYLLSSRILCRKSNQSWQDCSKNIKDKFDDIYVSATFDEINNQWLLIGNQSEQGKTTYLTATQTDNDWQIERQDASDDEGAQSFLSDIL